MRYFAAIMAGFWFAIAYKKFPNVDTGDIDGWIYGVAIVCGLLAIIG